MLFLAKLENRVNIVSISSILMMRAWMGSTYGKRRKWRFVRPHGSSDAVFEALRALDIAREAHVAALRDLSGAIILSGEVATAAMIAWQL